MQTSEWKTNVLRNTHIYLWLWLLLIGFVSFFVFVLLWFFSCCSVLLLLLLSWLLALVRLCSYCIFFVFVVCFVENVITTPNTFKTTNSTYTWWNVKYKHTIVYVRRTATEINDSGCHHLHNNTAAAAKTIQCALFHFVSIWLLCLHFHFDHT